MSPIDRGAGTDWMAGENGIPITGRMVGLPLMFEDLVTQPAYLELLGSHCARLTLFEGRYHQVKRMFGHFRNRVLHLHRESMGPLRLDSGLAPGHYRPLTQEEIQLI